jgi:formylglycine-generating enzyme required for sulfatase activity
LPKDGLWGFVEIPEGPFTMGSDDSDGFMGEIASPADSLILPTYYMARWPVTVAQFQGFVAATGWQTAESERLNGLANHPVVWVNWRDALAYCEWLTEQLQRCEATPEPLKCILQQPGGRVTLPSEAEWEKAARGVDGRPYPWGEAFGVDLANGMETGIGATTTVGCFPKGRSPYGVEEALGNVWEWTRSRVGNYPYPSSEMERREREDLYSGEDEPRVLLGGAFSNVSQDVRCAVRYDFDARCADYFVGFRVVLSSLPYL